MRCRTIAAALILTLLVAGAAAAQEWRGGKARVDGVVRNEKGEPVPGATVKLRWGKSGRGGPDLTADKQGRWAIGGIMAGPWDVDFEAPGYLPKKISIALQEATRNPTVEVQLEPQPQAAPAPAAAEPAILVGGKKISKETAAAIEAGNAAMSSRNWAGARENYLKALPELPDNTALIQRVAAAYLGEGNNDEALRYARMAVEKNPQDPQPWGMIAEIELQKGHAEEGLAALDKVPPEKITNNALYLNAGILLYNKKKLAEAEPAFDKAIAIKPDATAYYYRGLARYQRKKTKEAKADFEKALELEPNGADAKDIKDILKTIP
ncbi:MAG: tetratricopeptide repeat protein [Thermoanaerobaculia bacterium]